MDKLPVIEADLTKAKDALKLLEDDLPQFHALLTENERDAQHLKSERASLDMQAQAKGRVNVAREMLEQHQADLQAARAEVARLEALKQREQHLERMYTAAVTAKAHRAAMDKAFENAQKAMHRATELLLREWQGEHEARRLFAEIGDELVPGFRTMSDPYHAGMTNEQRLRLDADRATLLDDLIARDVPLEVATDGATGRHSTLDKYAERELPRDEVSLHIWQIFLELAGSEAQLFARFVPKPQRGFHIR